MDKPSIVKFTPPPRKTDSPEEILEQIEILKKDMTYILSQLEERICDLEN